MLGLANKYSALFLTRHSWAQGTHDQPITELFLLSPVVASKSLARIQTTLINQKKLE